MSRLTAFTAAAASYRPVPIRENLGRAKRTIVNADFVDLALEILAYGWFPPIQSGLPFISRLPSTAISCARVPLTYRRSVSPSYVDARCVHSFALSVVRSCYEQRVLIDGCTGIGSQISIVVAGMKAICTRFALYNGAPTVLSRAGPNPCLQGHG